MPSPAELIAPRRMGRDFRWLLASSWTSNIGDGIALAAAPLLIASMTSAPILVASGAILQFLPWLLFGLHAGAVADRFDRRRLVMLANGARALVVTALIVFLLTGIANIWIVLAVAFLYGTAEVFVDTAGSAILPMLVKPADLGIGNARLQAGYLVANQFAGPPLGAFLFAAGSAWPFAAQALCVALAVILIARMTLTPLPAKEATARTAVRTDIAEGLRWLWKNPPVRTLVIIILVFNVTWAAPWGVLVLYATEHLGMGPVGFGLYAFIWGTISTTVRQRLVPQELQGRIASVNLVGVFGGLVIGQALGGLIAQFWGLTAPWWFAFAGAALTLVLVWRPISHIVSAKPVADGEDVDAER